MPEKEEVLLQSIKKLISLGVKDEEIILNLKDVGVSAAEARALLNQAKGKPKPSEEELAGKIAAELKSKEVKEIKKFSEAEEKKAEEKAEEKEVEKKEAPKEFKQVEGIEGEDLWDKGIISSINEKIDEIESIKENIDSVIDAKVKKGLEKEVKRVRMLLDSEYARMNERVKLALEKRATEITSRVDQRINELDRLRKLLNQKLDKQQAGKQEIEQFVASANKLLTDLKGIKSNLSTKVPEIDRKVNSALELQAKAVDGLMKNTALNVDSLFKKDEAAFKGSITRKVSNLVQVSKQLNPKAVDARLAKIESSAAASARRGMTAEKKAVTDSIASMQGDFTSLKQKMEQTLSQARFEKEFIKLRELRSSVRAEGEKVKLELEGFKGEFKKIIAAQISGRVVDVQKEFDSMIQSKRSELRQIATDAAKKARPEKFDQKMAELALFKEQFLKTIEKNVDSLKETRSRIASKMNNEVKSIDTKINLIDLKMKELDEFEKKFANTMGLTIERLVKKKEKKQSGSAKKKSVKSKKTSSKGKASPLNAMIQEIKKKKK